MVVTNHLLSGMILQVGILPETKTGQQVIYLGFVTGDKPTDLTVCAAQDIAGPHDNDLNLARLFNFL